MNRVYVFLADGFEEIEGLTVVDLLRRADVPVDMVSITGKKEITGSHGIRVQADLLFEEADAAQAVMYVLPGGMPGTKHLGAHAGLAGLLKAAEREGKKVAAICAAPSVLGDLGLLNGHTAVCYPGFEDRLTGAVVTKESVEVSGNVTTSRGMGTAIPFALALVAQLAGQEKAEELGRGIIWNA